MTERDNITQQHVPSERVAGEDFIHYWIRLFENKDAYGLSCEQIADLLNRDQGVSYGESKWRKDYSMFTKGREYERRLMNGSICNRILCLSDFHVPFHLPISTFEPYVGKVDTLILNGDIGDCQAISKFPKAYRISPMEELIQTRTFLIELIEFLKPKKVICLYGNHDLRFQNYLSKHLDTDILELMPKTSLELILLDGFKHYDKKTHTKSSYLPLCEEIDSVDIEYVDSWYTQVGDAIFCHPIAFSSSILQTANRAVSYFRNEGFAFKQLICAHTHRIGSYKVGDTMLYEQGCCCDVQKMNYHDGLLTPSQQAGYIFLGQDAQGNTIPSSVELISLK